MLRPEKELHINPVESNHQKNGGLDYSQRDCNIKYGLVIISLLSATNNYLASCLGSVVLV